MYLNLPHPLINFKPKNLNTVIAFKEDLIETLKANNWEEPTKEKYPTMSLKNVGKRTTRLGLKTTVWYEDIHYVWRNYKPKS